MTKKTNLGSLLMAGAAAYGLYKLSKLSAQQRSDLLAKGKQLVNDNLGGLKNVLGSNGTNNTAARTNNFADEASHGA